MGISMNYLWTRPILQWTKKWCCPLFLPHHLQFHMPNLHSNNPLILMVSICFFNVENVKMHFFLLKSTWMRSCDLYTLSSLRHFIITAILLPAITFLMYFAFLIDETWLLHFLFDIICTRFLHQSFTSGLDSTTQTYILFSTPEEVLCCFVQY